MLKYDRSLPDPWTTIEDLEVLAELPWDDDLGYSPGWTAVAIDASLEVFRIRGGIGYVVTSDALGVTVLCSDLPSLLELLALFEPFRLLDQQSRRTQQAAMVMAAMAAGGEPGPSGEDLPLAMGEGVSGG